MENIQKTTKWGLYKMEKVTFVLTACNSMPHIRATIESLYKSTSYPFKLIIVESESTDGTKEYVDSLIGDIKVIHTKREGTIKAINTGIKEADKDSHIFLCHDDIIFFSWYMRDWLVYFMNIIKDDSIGIVIPVNGGGISGEDYIYGFSWAGTWSTLIRKEAVNKLGREKFLDENFGKGYGDDIDMTYRVVKEGYNVAKYPIWIDHHRLTEHKNNDDINIEEYKKRNSKYFKEKHKLGKKEEIK